MTGLIDKNGKEINVGSVITWSVWDSDDFVTWEFVGIARKDHVTYLGGGIDFGTAIGSKIGYDEVIDQSENNDDCNRGISVIGKQSDIPKVIKKGLG